MPTASLTIGFLARAAAVNIETVRYYQRVGLITTPPKPENGYRQYPTDTIDRIQFIKRAQKLGFNLTEIAELLDLGDGHCEDVRQRAQHKRDMIDQQLKDLTALRTTLDDLINACLSDDKKQCPIVKTLSMPVQSK